jgi:hypothetical protein
VARFEVAEVETLRVLVDVSDAYAPDVGVGTLSHVVQPSDMPETGQPVQLVSAAS